MSNLSLDPDALPAALTRRSGRRRLGFVSRQQATQELMSHILSKDEAAIRGLYQRAKTETT